MQDEIDTQGEGTQCNVMAEGIEFLSRYPRETRFTIRLADLFTDWDQFNRRSIDDGLESDASNLPGLCKSGFTLDIP